MNCGGVGCGGRGVREIKYLGGISFELARCLLVGGDVGQVRRGNCGGVGCGGRGERD